MESHPCDIKTCPKCEAKFACGIASGHETCWCFDQPHVLPAPEHAACLCPECLKQEITAKRCDSPAQEHDAHGE